MGVVTITAIFRDRCVLPKIRTTFFRVAVKASVVQRLLYELQIGGRAMITVTAAAVHFALAYGVGVRLQRLRSLLLVAVETDLRLCRSHQNRILRRMARMAIGAGNFVDVVVVAVPAKARICCVTIHAESVLGVDRCRRVLAEDSAGSGAFLAAAYPPGMIPGWSVAGFALQLAVTERSVRVRRVGVRSFKQDKDRIVLVTREAGICAFATEVGVLLTTSWAGGQDTERRYGDGECYQPHGINDPLSSSAESRVHDARLPRRLYRLRRGRVRKSLRRMITACYRPLSSPQNRHHFVSCVRRRGN